MEQGEERKTTLKMKPHWVRKPFQAAAAHSIEIITILQSIHKHQNNYIEHTEIQVTPSTLLLNKYLVQNIILTYDLSNISVRTKVYS